MSSARRYDAAQVAPGGATRDGRGFLVVPAYVTRTGVLTYRRADGTVVRELRHPDEVFRADSLDTLLSAPVTIGHPDGWVDSANAQSLEVGVVHDAQAAQPYVSSRLSVRRADAIKRIDARELVEVSCGYDTDIDPTPGEFEGQRYDQVQRNIRYNHVALLPKGKGRCGGDVRLRQDSADAVIDEEPGAPAPKSADETRREPVKEPQMSTRKVRVDGVEFELPETAASVLDKVVAERDAAKNDAAGHKKRADAAEAERDIVKGQLAEASDPKNLSALVAQRVELERQATKVLGQDHRLDGMSDRQVREKVLGVVSKDFKTEGRSDDAITAAFDYAIASSATVNQGLKVVTQALNQGETHKPEEARTDAIDFASEFAKLEERRQNAWKGKAS